MNSLLLFLAIAHERRSFAEASFICALLELGSADKQIKTTGGNLLQRNLPDLGFSKRLLHRVSTKLARDGVLSVSVQKNKRTIYEVPTHFLDEALDRFDPTPTPNELQASERLVALLHRLSDYDEAVLLSALMNVPADELPVKRLGELIEPFGERMDRHRARRALYRLADRGLAALAPKDRSGMGATLNSAIVADLLARPLPDLRYLRADAYASQPYFIARAARIPSSVAPDVEAPLSISPAASASLADVVSGSFSNERT